MNKGFVQVTNNNKLIFCTEVIVRSETRCKCYCPMSLLQTTCLKSHNEIISVYRNFSMRLFWQHPLWQHPLSQETVPMKASVTHFHLSQTVFGSNGSVFGSFGGSRSGLSRRLIFLGNKLYSTLIYSTVYDLFHSDVGRGGVGRGGVGVTGEE